MTGSIQTSNHRGAAGRNRRSLISRSALILFALVNAPLPTYADTLTPQQINALNNLQEEYTTCSYYYRLQISCATPEWKEKLEAQLDPIMKLCDRAAIRIGNGIGMTKDAIEQRLRRVAADMGRATNNSVCINMDSLYARYQTRCKQLLENPDAILDEHLRK